MILIVYLKTCFFVALLSEFGFRFPGEAGRTLGIAHGARSSTCTSHALAALVSGGLRARQLVFLKIGVWPGRGVSFIEDRVQKSTKQALLHTLGINMK